MKQDSQCKKLCGNFQTTPKQYDWDLFSPSYTRRIGLKLFKWYLATQPENYVFHEQKQIKKEKMNSTFLHSLSRKWAVAHLCVLAKRKNGLALEGSNGETRTWRGDRRVTRIGLGLVSILLSFLESNKEVAYHTFVFFNGKAYVIRTFLLAWIWYIIDNSIGHSWVLSHAGCDLFCEGILYF